jgi:hypothetical protein
MLTALLAVVGQLADARTTEVALKNGSIEKNPLVAKLISKYGVKGLYAVKFAVPVLLSLLGLASLNLVVAAVGVAAAGYNYARLRRQGINGLTGKKS